MAFWSIFGNDQVTNFGPDGFPTGIDLDAGSIRALTNEGGSVTNDRFSNVFLGEGNPVITLSSGVDYIDPVNSAAPLASWNGGDQVIVKVTTDIASLSNNVLLFGASDSANSPAINQLAVLETKLYKTAVRNGQWNPVDGEFSPAVSVVNSGAWSIADNADESTSLVPNATDDAANPTQAVPGELVYMEGDSDPTQDEYKPKNLW